MPVIFTPEDDLFRVSPFVDIMVNPVNCMGAMGKGLAKEFKERHPDMFARYKVACEENRMEVGKLHIFRSSTLRYQIVNLPTKVHWVDDSDPEYIKKGLMALRRYLEIPGNEKMTVAMPMLGCGYGNLEQDEVKPVFEACLEDLPNVVLVTQRPSMFKPLPKILVVFGPRQFASPKLKDQVNTAYGDQIAYVKKKIAESLDKWGLQISDFYAVMSGGAGGVDTAACGTSQSDTSYQTSIFHELTKGTDVKVVVAQADWDRWGKRAGMLRNEFMADVGTHFIGFTPPNIPHIGTSAMIRWLETCNTKLAEKESAPTQSRFYKNTLIYGNDLVKSINKQIII